MADTKISALSELAERPAAGDLAVIVDVSDTSMAASGTDKKIQCSNLLGRETLKANRTYYVRTDGSDSNTGLADSAGGAFLTIQKAIDVVWDTIDIAGYACVIQVRSGTYTAGITKAGSAVGGIPSLLGDTTTPGNVIVSVTAPAQASAFDLKRGLKLEIGGFKVTTITSGHGFHVSSNSLLLITGKMEFGAAPSGYYHLSAAHNSNIGISANYTISGGADVHWNAANNGVFQVVSSNTFTLSGTPAFAVAFAQAVRGGVIQESGSTFSGSATGTRFSIASGGAITGQLATFPGNVAGAYDDAINIQTFTGSGTYTPTAGMKFCRVRVQAPGGGGGGADGVGASANDGVISGGGGGGEYAEGILSSAQIGTSQSVTIGAVGTAGTTAGGTGGTGGTTSLGSLITAIGGSGGVGTGSDSASSVARAGGAGGTGGSGGSVRIPGGYGSAGKYFYDGANNGRQGGSGGNATLGSGSEASVIAYGSGGSDGGAVNGQNYGGGGSGATDNDNTGSAGGTGGAGIIIVEEFF